MFRTATLLIVVILAGGPGLLTCHLWCTSPAADSHQFEAGCHHEGSRASLLDWITPVVDCHAALGTPPFVTQTQLTETGSRASVPLTFFTSSAIAHDVEVAGEWRIAALLQPPQPLLPLAVLRL
jgi:hypothetical protein